MLSTDLFIKRPVIAISLSLLILLAGFWAGFNLPLTLYPQVDVPVVRVQTFFPGASPEIMQSYVTTQLQANLNGISGVDFVTSQSSQGSSSIDLHFQLGQNLDQAVATVMRKVQAVSGQLPNGAFPPNISAGEHHDYYFVLRANSKNTSLEWMTDYLNRMVLPQLELMNGVSEASIWGPVYSMDIRLNPEHLIAYNLSAQDVIAALTNYNTPAAPGKTYGSNISYALNPDTTLHTKEDFDYLIVKNAGTKSIYLKDVGTALFHGMNEDVHAYFNGVQGDAIAIATNPSSNPLTVAHQLYELLPKLQEHLPGQIQLGMIFDITKFISASLHEVIKAIGESLVIVVLVMLLLLGSPRAVLIPLSVIPLSLIGVCSLMWLCHYSFNTLTLLAMVLAIGLVVDDAIVVLENIVRHLEAGESRIAAALIGAREIAGPVIAMTLTLAAVYAPMLLTSGITGHLFSEFAMTLAGSVLISGIIALTLSPLLCSSLLSQQALQHRFVIQAEKRVNKFRTFYLYYLQKSFEKPRKILVAWVFIVISCCVLYQCTPHELVPDEDTGILQLAAGAPADVNLNYLEKYRADFQKILNQSKDITGYVEILQNNSLFGYVNLVDWSKRHISSKKLQANLQRDFNHIAGINTYISNISLLPGASSNNGITAVLLGNVDYPRLHLAAKKIEELAQRSGKFLYLHDNLEYNQPQINFEIDKNAAVAMNITPHRVASQLTSLLSQGRIQQFTWQGHSYDVAISIDPEYRRNPEDITNLHIPNQDGKLIPLSSLVKMKTTVVPQTLNQFQKMNSVTLSGVSAPGTSFSDALATLQELTRTELDKNIVLDYAGVTRQFLQEGNRSIAVFIIAVLVIFLVLSIQFNRFRDALIILLGSVPLALFGALLPLWLGLGTINIYTQIGFLTLIGLISKHGILLTEFANHAQLHDRLTPLEAILQAARRRFRPILMTTAAMVVGALPLVFAGGAGAESRRAIGIVIVSGLSIGTCCTLFVMPTLYLWLGRKSEDSAKASI